MLGDTADGLRTRVGAALFARVAGPNGPAARARIHGAPGPRWFAPDRPIRRVHGDASMFVGGLRALLLQSLHPSAMAAVAGHSDYRDDPWGRLQRTSTFLAVTTFGADADARAAVARVRAIHHRVRGTTDDGLPYHAADPHLLEWVHIAEVDSFLHCHQLYGRAPLTPDEADGYVADAAVIARALGVPSPPESTADLAARLTAYRPELRGSPQAREAARFLLLKPPLPVPALPAYAAIATAAIATMPTWTRIPLRLPLLPLTERTIARWAGRGVTSAIRWAMPTPPES